MAIFVTIGSDTVQRRLHTERGYHHVGSNVALQLVFLSKFTLHFPQAILSFIQKSLTKYLDGET